MNNKKTMETITIMLLLLLLLVAGCDNAESPVVLNPQENAESAAEEMLPPRITEVNANTQEQNDQDTDRPTVRTIQPQETPLVFDLPENWEWSSQEKGIAKLERQREEGLAPASKIVFISAESGTEDEARRLAYGAYEQYILDCESRLECDAAAIRREAYTLDFDGVNVYVYAMPSKTWAGEAWQSNLSFRKDGKIVQMILYGDPARTYEDELRVIIESFDLN